MSAFQWQGSTYPFPPGWEGLSIEDWFLRLETVRDDLMHASDRDLEPMHDDDGSPLDPEEVLLIAEHGFQSGSHWEAFRGWGVWQWAARTGEDPTNLEFRMGGIARERILATKAQSMSGPGGGLSPVDGVTLEQWAWLQARLASGGDIDALLAHAGMDRPKWDRVSAEWMTRMQTDTTAAIATAYGNAFAAGSQSPFGAAAAHAGAVGVGGDLGREPLSFAQFVEIHEAMGAAASRGQDANALLASFGLSAVDWGHAGMYWNKRMQQDATTYHQLFTQYSEHYRAKYSVG